MRQSSAMRTGTMARILLLLGWLATLGLVATAVVGYQFQGQTEAISRHILLGLVSLLILVLVHSWIFFFLLGTSRAVRTTVGECGLDRSLVARAAEFKAAACPWLVAASTLATVDFFLGSQVYTADVSRWAHHALFFVTVATQLGALGVETRVLQAHERLMVEIDGLCAG